ncbi:MAG TPA: PDZ domain-containing protein, partial [Candidatus Eisenbacteria bacterium]
GFGIGGPINATLITGNTLAIGPHEVTGILTRLPDPGNGAFDAEDVAGSIGTGVLKRFQLRVDYPGRTLWLKPGTWFEEGDACDRAGLWLARRGEELEVVDVVSGGPAESAGLSVGDRIVRVGGSPARSIMLPDFRRRLATDPAGTRIEFVVRNSKGTTSRQLVLRDLLPGAEH